MRESFHVGRGQRDNVVFIGVHNRQHVPLDRHRLVGGEERVDVHLPAVGRVATDHLAVAGAVAALRHAVPLVVQTRPLQVGALDLDAPAALHFLLLRLHDKCGGLGVVGGAVVGLGALVGSGVGAAFAASFAVASAFRFAS